MSITPNRIVDSRRFHSQSAHKINTVTIYFIAQALIAIHDGCLVILVYQWNDANENGYDDHNNTFCYEQAT